MLETTLEVASAVYIAHHLLLRFAALYLLGTRALHKPRQITFAAVSVTGLSHAVDLSLAQWSIFVVIALDIVTVFGLFLLLVIRHNALTKLRPGTIQLAKGVSSPSRTSEHYTLFVIGSGGHTAEMLSMIERSIRPLQSSTDAKSPRPQMMRRYVVSHGDTMSIRKVHALEASIAARFASLGADPGVYDVKLVARARRVHQSWLSTPVSFARSILSIFGALCAAPRPLTTTSTTNTTTPSPSQAARHPGVLVTNGPGTAFAVVLVSHALRVLRLVPETHMHAIYVESFAKVSTLSLTGRLLYALDLADQFIVQWPKLHERYPRSMLCPYFSVRPAAWMVPEADEGKA
ncbi:oligosaccharide biosynthesis protein Alg14 like-domain-containing protein [Microdochium bolleyi]|uniref:UDP-N-acetylglucosamine transferase subunit ALG14 n=1 Tax=Microdochium bolleyi TaxID=196109 RepID=A0A136IP97_9PEZI|nr:oligosaccharide biosynthesis protein Alg14 like-domain-containing protein [Microdochium bolleyi]